MMLCPKRIEGVKSLAFVSMISMPSLTSLQQKFAFMSLLPEYIIEIHIYISIHLSKLDSWKNRVGKPKSTTVRENSPTMRSNLE